MAHAAFLANTITLTPSLPSGVGAGTSITWTASSTDPNPLVYQFSVAYDHLTSLIARDFSPKASFNWTPQVEGSYTVTVVVKEINSGAVLGYGNNPTSQASVTYSVTTAVTTTAIIVPTSNPLVAQYRAPSCPTGDVVVLQFRAVGALTWTTSSARLCSPLTQPFYAAGMLPSTTYQMRHIVLSAPGSAVVSVSPKQTFVTGSLPTSLTFSAVTAPQGPNAQSDTTAGIIDFQYNITGTNQVNPMATNLKGRVVWYAHEADLRQTWSLRDESGTQFLAGNDGQQTQTNGGLNILRQIDLAGNSLRETNIGAINDQLTATGNRPIYGFHHDALTLPNGDVALLAFTTATITTTPVLGDDIIVLDPNLHVIWVWDSFAHLDVNRGPTLGDICGSQMGFLCPVPGGASTIDWLHSNALAWSALDNNLLLSMRSQDWVIKINYNNGLGDGSVVWHLGQGGDFGIVPANPADPSPWFSHQHNPNLLDFTRTLAVFDNGNTRCNGAAAGTCHSRGQEYLLDEARMVVTQTLNIDLGNYSPALGTAQRLDNGNFNFDSGAQGSPPSFGQAIEVQRDGTKDYVAQIAATVPYRAWRLTTMYATTNPACPTCTVGN